jgi:hypothetical protein
MEEYILNIKKHRTHWENENGNKSVIPKIRKGIEEGSYPCYSVYEENLPKLLRYTWNGKLNKLKNYLYDVTKHWKINREDEYGR